ncbi:hypothetical protein RFI_04683, partial [Reticulomyxa filosa]
MQLLYIKENKMKCLEVDFRKEDTPFLFIFLYKKKIMTSDAQPFAALFTIINSMICHGDVDSGKMKCNGGMQDNNYNDTNEKDRKYVTEVKTLIRLFGDSINTEELQKKIANHNGNIELVIKDIVQQFVEKEKQEQENNKSVQKETEQTEIGETKPGINLQGYCSNETCLASKAKLPVWVNIGFNDITFISDKTSFSCPDCKKLTITSIVKAMFYNSEHSICASGDSIPVKDNNYQCSYTIKFGLSYELKANEIRQHAKSIEDLRERSEQAMNSIEINKFSDRTAKIRNYRNERLFEKIQADYGGNFNQAFDIGRFTILCDNPTKLQTAVAVMKKAEQFNLIVSEDRDFFDKKSRTHHRFHNIKLY